MLSMQLQTGRSRSGLTSNPLSRLGHPPSFYSSQGRQTAFPDHNAGLVNRLLTKVPRLATLEMETFHLYHLASVYPRVQPLNSPVGESCQRRGGIRASAVQMVFADRMTQEFITPGHVLKLEHWVGQACLDALTQFEIAEQLLHPPEDSVWA